jgi:hypothetical protein
MEELAEQHSRVHEAKEKRKRIREYSQLVKEEYRPRAKSGAN